MNYFRLSFSLFVVLLLAPIFMYGQNKPKVDSSYFYRTVRTYVNPVLPGDHSDPTLLKVGKDFYHCGSSFHFNPYLPIYHSTDLVHWKIIGRVLPSADAAWVTDHPSAGIWQGAISYFYGSYWIYFSANGQWFSKAANPAGPWSTPLPLKTDRETGNLGYDNSIFVDDDGKPYILIKNGQKVLQLDTATRTIVNPFGRTVWLKLVRNGHQLNGYLSGDKKTWISLGASVSAIKLDKAQPNFNSWVGTSVGLFAEGKPADFGCFICKDGRSILPAIGYSNYFGTDTISLDNEKAVINTTNKGSWFMISGVETGRLSPLTVELTAQVKASTKIEILLDDLQNGRLIATFNLDATRIRQWKIFCQPLKDVTGQHDVFVRFSPGTARSTYIKSIQFSDHTISKHKQT